jgi:hypothetical protein
MCKASISVHQKSGLPYPFMVVRSCAVFHLIILILTRDIISLLDLTQMALRVPSFGLSIVDGIIFGTNVHSGILDSFLELFKLRLGECARNPACLCHCDNLFWFQLFRYVVQCVFQIFYLSENIVKFVVHCRDS